jgi:hypothetical protein
VSPFATPWCRASTGRQKLLRRGVNFFGVRNKKGPPAERRTGGPEAAAGTPMVAHEGARAHLRCHPKPGPQRAPRRLEASRKFMIHRRTFVRMKISCVLLFDGQGKGCQVGPRGLLARLPTSGPDLAPRLPEGCRGAG